MAARFASLNTEDFERILKEKDALNTRKEFACIIIMIILAGFLHGTVYQDYIHETLAEWKKLELDVLLCPMLGPALNFNYAGKQISATTYTAVYNVFNFPAGVVPVTEVTAEDEDQLKNYRGNFGDIWDKIFVTAIRGGVGLPIAVQCVALPWQEEMCLRLMREVEKLCAKNKQTNMHH